MMTEWTKRLSRPAIQSFGFGAWHGTFSSTKDARGCRTNAAEALERLGSLDDIIARLGIEDHENRNAGDGKSTQRERRVVERRAFA